MFIDNTLYDVCLSGNDYQMDMQYVSLGCWRVMYMLPSACLKSPLNITWWEVTSSFVHNCYSLSLTSCRWTKYAATSLTQMQPLTTLSSTTCISTDMYWRRSLDQGTCSGLNLSSFPHSLICYRRLHVCCQSSGLKSGTSKPVYFQTYPPSAFPSGTHLTLLTEPLDHKLNDT